MPYVLKMFVLTDSLMCLPRCGCRLNICQQLLRRGSLQLACSQIEKVKLSMVLTCSGYFFT